MAAVDVQHPMETTYVPATRWIFYFASSSQTFRNPRTDFLKVEPTKRSISIKFQLFFFQPSFFLELSERMTNQHVTLTSQEKVIHKKMPVVMQLPSPICEKKSCRFWEGWTLKENRISSVETDEGWEPEGKKGDGVLWISKKEGAREKFPGFFGQQILLGVFFVRPTLISTNFWNCDVFVCGIFDDDDDDDEEEEEEEEVHKKHMWVLHDSCAFWPSQGGANTAEALRPAGASEDAPGSSLSNWSIRALSRIVHKFVATQVVRLPLPRMRRSHC